VHAGALVSGAQQEVRAFANEAQACLAVLLAFCNDKQTPLLSARDGPR
jgi:hypothetical protein